MFALMRLVSLLLFIWLAIGALAGWQRDYYQDTPKNCAKAGTIAATIAAGPLNYVGVNPKVKDCPGVPQPSK